MLCVYANNCSAFLPRIPALNSLKRVRVLKQLIQNNEVIKFTFNLIIFYAKFLVGAFFKIIVVLLRKKCRCQKHLRPQNFCVGCSVVHIILPRHWFYTQNKVVLQCTVMRVLKYFKRGGGAVSRPRTFSIVLLSHQHTRKNLKVRGRVL